MIPKDDVHKIARARFEDAAVLMMAKRYEGAVYLCGYAIELGLKARICNTLNWQGFPESKSEFQGYQSFKTHDLDVLLHLSGIEEEIKSKYFAEWSAVAQWNPEARYNPIGTVHEPDAKQMMQAAEVLLKNL